MGLGGRVCVQVGLGEIHVSRSDLPPTCLPSYPTQVSAVGYGMEEDQHEARLKELFDSFDTLGTGSLGQEELTDLCHVLCLEDVGPVLQQTLLQDNLLGRVRSGGRTVCWKWGTVSVRVLGLVASHKVCCNLSLETWPLAWGV